jgi:hypothetical protein
MNQDFGFFPDKEKQKKHAAHKAKVPLHPEEDLLRVYHQTGFVLLKPVAIFLAGTIIPALPLARYGLLSQYKLLFFLLVIGLLGYVLKKWAIWSLNSYIITSQRLIRISHEGLFKKLVLETPLDRILNVSYKTTGLTSVFFGYGDVEVQVVGLIEPMILRHISDPAAIKDYLWKAHSEYTERKGRFTQDKIAHLQEEIGYTKQNQRVL